MEDDVSAAGSGPRATLSDAELLHAIRGGDAEAYAELWRRHVRAALRLAHRIAPGHADDLVSDAFLAVHHQLTVVGNGPHNAFRAYLFTTMRNTAMRWQKTAALVENDPDIDSIDYLDPSSILADRARSSELLDAFQSLPERWQRVLWLTEVQDAARPAIASELGIKPNAVSALYRRARTGLRLQWLIQQVPPELRDDRDHVAGLLPELVLRERTSMLPRRISMHLKQCSVCAELSADLINAHRRMSRKTLGALGFAGLGVVLPAASQLTSAGAGAAAAMLVVGGTAIAATMSVVVVVGLSPGNLSQPKPQETHTVTQPESEGSRDAEREHPNQPGTGVEADEPDPISDEPDSSSTGRWNTDPDIPSTSLSRDDAPSDNYVVPRAPSPLEPGEAPDPGEADTPPDGSNPAFGPGITTPTDTQGYLAPVLTGTTSPGAQVTVELRAIAAPEASPTEPQRFASTVADDGAWTFDPRALLADRHGEFEYQVWAHTDEQSSPAETGRFTISTPEVVGFESIAPFEPIPLAEAAETGIVATITGPPGGTICLTSVWPGQTTELPLDEDGNTTQRIRFLGAGWYYLTFRACEGEHRGPPFEVNFDVIEPESPGMSPFGPDPTTTRIEVSDP